MASGLETLLAEGIISEVVARLKSGKEAEVFVVRYGGKLVAAKVYKDRGHRSFKNNSAYKEGRSVRSSRTKRAIDRGSKFGQATAEDAWKFAEVDALYKLHAAGVRVPTPVMYLEGVLLMELLLDGDGDAAPRLIDIQLSPEQANAAYKDMVQQLVRILACDLIHGDLSPYNVLWAASGPTIIDFPQIISAAHNSSAEGFFLRDARNILGHLAAIDRNLGARSGDASEIWRAYRRRELTPDFLPTGRIRPPAPPRAPVVEPRPRSFDRSGPRTQGPAPAPPQAPSRPHRPHDRPQAAPNAGRPQELRPQPPRDAGRPARPSPGQRPAPRAPEVIIMRARPAPPQAPAPEREPTPTTERTEQPRRRRRPRR